MNPALLTVTTGSPVSRVIVEGGRVRGVEVIGHGSAGSLRCSGDVFLSGGTMGSAQLLLLSGLGPADELRALGIDVAADLPGVGANLHDHALVPVAWQSSRPLPPGTANKLEAHYFAKTDPTMTAPDLQPLMSHAPIPVAGRLRRTGRGAWLHRSRGHDPSAQPRPDVAALSRPHPAARARSAVLRRPVRPRSHGDGDQAGPRDRPTAGTRRPAFLRDRSGPDVVTDAEIAAYAKKALMSYHHQVGTCRMGTGPDAVVDPLLRVHGVPGLRVADASVMPAVPSGNTHAPAVMIGERCADFVLGESS